MPSYPSRGAARASSRTRNPRPSNQWNARISANRASSRGHSWPSTGPASRRWTGDGRTQPRRTCRKTPLRCRLSRPPLQSSASLSHRFPTTPRHKHSRTRRLQRRLMRRARCREPAPSPSLPSQLEKELPPPIVFQHFSCLQPHLHFSLSENSIDLPPPPPTNRTLLHTPPPPPPHLLLLPPHPSSLPPFSPPSFQPPSNPSLVCPSTRLPLSQDVQRLREQPGGGSSEWGGYLSSTPVSPACRRLTPLPIATNPTAAHAVRAAKRLG